MINKKKLQKQKQQWKIQKDLIIQQEQLKNQKREIKNKYKKLTTTKLLILFLFLNCTVIEIITFILTFKSFQTGAPDFSALQMLITAVVGQVVSFSIYSLKSLKQNTSGGIIYQTAMLEKQMDKEEYNQEDVQ